MPDYHFQTDHCGIIDHEIHDQKTKEFIVTVPKIVLLDNCEQSEVDWNEAASLVNWLTENTTFDERVKRTVTPFYVVSEGAFRIAQLGLDPRRIPSGLDTKNFRADYKVAKAEGRKEQFKAENLEDFIRFSASEIRRKSKNAIEMGYVTSEKVEELVADAEAENREKYGV